MSDSPGVDSAALRREARRRRILENSEKRLRSITGRPVSDSSEARQESGNSFLYDFQNPLVSDVFGEPDEGLSPELDVDEDFLTRKPRADDVDEGDAAATKNEGEPNEICGTWLKTMIHRRLHFIVLSVIVQLMYVFKLGHLFCNNLFCPFITAKLMEFWLVPDPYKIDNQEQFELMSAMFKGSMARYMLRAYYIFAVIASDFCLYVFVIVASDKLFNLTLSPYLAH